MDPQYWVKNPLQEQQLLSEDRDCCFIKSKDTDTSDVNHFCLAEGDIFQVLRKAAYEKLL